MIVTVCEILRGFFFWSYYHSIDILFCTLSNFSRMAQLLSRYPYLFSLKSVFQLLEWIQMFTISYEILLQYVFYDPNFGEVEGAYWFGPSVRLSVTLWQLRNPRTAHARILKLYMWHVHEK